MPSSPRRVLALSVALLVAGLAVLVGAVPASAHGDAGVIVIDTPEPRGDLTVGLQVLLTYENDDEPVTGDEVGEIVAVGTGPGGQTIGPQVSLVATDVPGVFAADLTFPAAGMWELTVTSSEPAASATTTVEVADAAPEETDGSDDGDEADEPTTDMTISADDEGSARIVERGSGDGSSTPLLVTLLVAGVLAAAGIAGAVVLRRRNRSS